MLRLIGAEPGEARARPGPLRAGLVSLACFLRALPLFFRATPATPLRVLCIVALDTIHALRCSRPIPARRRAELAAFLDFQACTNAAWDRKPLRAAEYQALRQRLESAGLGPWVAEYLARLHPLETERPAACGDRRRFDDVRSYREAVARLSLATIAAIALDARCIDEGIRATHGDGDMAVLFQMAMQCQIIDDVLDYRADLSACLPSFLTASVSLREARAATAAAARAYAGPSATGGMFPLRVALAAVTVVTALVVAVGPVEYEAEVS